MMFNDIKRLSFKHKNNKPWYYVKNYIRQYIPTSIYRKRLQQVLITLHQEDKEYILKRVCYYNKLKDVTSLSNDSVTLAEFKPGKKNNTYFFDAYEFTRYFSLSLRASFLFGDVIHIPEYPSIVKSRPIYGDNTNSVVMKLDKIRHFLFVNDSKKFESKKNMLVGRSKAKQQHRIRFLEKYFDHPLCNIGQVNRDINQQFIAPRMTIEEHLNSKFILCLEGFDVASNLKWVMSSNSIAVMPRPKYETWFMEGTLIPNYHYIEIKDDYSDLEERLNYYIENTHEALKIIENAHLYIEQFKDKKREDLISLLVLDKYFRLTC